jgi:hypothetical protein
VHYEKMNFENSTLRSTGWSDIGRECYERLNQGDTTYYGYKGLANVLSQGGPTFEHGSEWPEAPHLSKDQRKQRVADLEVARLAEKAEKDAEKAERSVTFAPYSVSVRHHADLAKLLRQAGIDE